MHGTNGAKVHIWNRMFDMDIGLYRLSKIVWKNFRNDCMPINSTAIMAVEFLVGTQGLHIPIATSCNGTPFGS